MKDIVKQFEKQFGYKVGLASFFGSINYGLVTEDSDKDIMFWCFPTQKDLLTNTQITKQHIVFWHNREQYDIKIVDIRNMVSIFYSGVLLNWEQLFNKEEYHYVSDLMVDFLNELKQEEENLMLKLIKGCKGLATNHKNFYKMVEVHKNMEKSSLVHYFKKYGHATKSFSNVVRMYFVMKHITEGKLYHETLILEPEERQLILDIKENKVYTSHNMEKCLEYYNEFENLYQQAKAMYVETYQKNLNNRQVYEDKLLVILKDYYFGG